MPTIRDDILERIRETPGWAAASHALEGNGEKAIVFTRPSDGRKRLVSRSRRIMYRDDQGVLQPIDTSWQRNGNNPFSVGTNKYSFSVGDGGIPGLNFGATNFLRYTVGSKEISLNPTSIQFRDDTGLTQQIGAGVPNLRGTVGAGPTANVISWADPYGVGVPYALIVDADQVWKRLSVSDVSLLGNPLLVGGEIHLDVPHLLSLGDGITIWHSNGAGVETEWDRIGSLRTDGPLTFRDSVTGRFLAALRIPFIKTPTPQLPSTRMVLGGSLRDQFGSVTDEVSWYEVEALGRGQYMLHICFAWDVVSAISGPFILDPNVDTEAVGDTSDAEQNTYASAVNTGKNYADVRKFAGGDVRWLANFDISAISAGDTIDTAYMTISTGVAGVATTIRVVEEADHTFPASYAASVTAVSNWSSNSVSWTPTGSSGTAGENTPSIITLVEDCINAGGSVGEIGMWIEGTTSASNTVLYLIGYAGYQEEIHIEYTAGGGGGVIGQLVGGSLVGSGILRGRLVGKR